MASSSGGGHGPGDQSSSFKFVTKAEVSILDENDEDFEDTLDNLQEIETCLNELKTVTVNEKRKSSVRFCGLEKGEITWTADSAAEVIQFCKAVRDKNIQTNLNNYLKKKHIQDKLKLEYGKTIYIDVQIVNARKLKEEASHFFKNILDQQAHGQVGDCGQEDQSKKGEHSDPNEQGSEKYSSHGDPSGQGPQKYSSHDDPSGQGTQKYSSHGGSSGQGHQSYSSHDDPSGQGTQKYSSHGGSSGQEPQSHSSHGGPSGQEPQSHSSHGDSSGQEPQSYSSHGDPSGQGPQKYSSHDDPSGQGHQSHSSHDDPSGQGHQSHSSHGDSSGQGHQSYSSYGDPSGQGPQKYSSHDDPSGQGHQSHSSHGDPSGQGPQSYSSHGDPSGQGPQKYSSHDDPSAQGTQKYSSHGGPSGQEPQSHSSHGDSSGQGHQSYSSHGDSSGQGHQSYSSHSDPSGQGPQKYSSHDDPSGQGTQKYSSHGGPSGQEPQSHSSHGGPSGQETQSHSSHGDSSGQEPQSYRSHGGPSGQEPQSHSSHGGPSGQETQSHSSHGDSNGQEPQSHSSHGDSSGQEPQSYSSHGDSSGQGPQKYSSHDDPSGQGHQSHSSHGGPSGQEPQSHSSHGDSSGQGHQSYSSHGGPSGQGPQKYSSHGGPSGQEPQSYSSHGGPSGQEPQSHSSHGDSSGQEPQSYSSHGDSSGQGPQKYSSHDDPSGQGHQSHSSHGGPSGQEPQSYSSHGDPSGQGPQKCSSHDDPSGQGTQKYSSHGGPSGQEPQSHSSHGGPSGQETQSHSSHGDSSGQEPQSYRSHGGPSGQEPQSQNSHGDSSGQGPQKYSSHDDPSGQGTQKYSSHGGPSGQEPQSYSSHGDSSGQGPQKCSSHDDPSGQGTQKYSSHGDSSGQEPQSYRSHGGPSGQEPQSQNSHGDSSGQGHQSYSLHGDSSGQGHQSYSSHGDSSGQGHQKYSSHGDSSGQGHQSHSSHGDSSGQEPQSYRSHGGPSGQEPQSQNSHGDSSGQGHQSYSLHGDSSGQGHQSYSSHGDSSGQGHQKYSSHGDSSGQGHQSYSSHGDSSGQGHQSYSSHGGPSGQGPQSNSSQGGSSGQEPQSHSSHGGPSGQGSQTGESGQTGKGGHSLHLKEGKLKRGDKLLSEQAVEKGYEKILVLEDDVRIEPYFRKKFNIRFVSDWGTCKTFRVWLHVAEDLKAKSVVMEYVNENNKQKKMNLVFEKSCDLWYSEKINFQQSCEFAFDIYQSTSRFASIMFRDEHWRSCDINRPMLRKLFRHSIEGFVAHIIHICIENKTKQLGSALQDIDDLFKGISFKDEEKRDLFSSVMMKVKSSSLSFDAKAINTVCYIIDKLQVILKPVGDVPELALFLLKSFITLESLSDTQRPVIKDCAELLYKIAYPRISILILMKHTMHLFSSSYFKALHERKVMTFSSGSSDNDEDLQVEMFHKLATNAELDEDSGYLFKLLIEDTPLQKVLKFHYEQYPTLIDKVDQLLKGRITVEIVGLKSSMDLKRFEDLSRLVSRHPSLSEQHFVDLRTLVLQLLRAPPLAKSLTPEDFFRVFEVPSLFVEETDKETLLETVSRSQHEVYHTMYLKLLDRLDIQDGSIIDKTACNWLDVLIDNIRVDERCKSQAECIPMLYQKLQKLVEANNIRKDSEFLTILKEKVFNWLVGVDLQEVLEWSLQKDMVDNIFFEHFKKFATDQPDVLLILESALKKSDEDKPKVQGYKVISIGLEVLGRRLTKDPDENFIMMLENWRLCVAAINLFLSLRCNGILVQIFETRKMYNKCIHDKTVAVHVVTKVENLCQKMGMGSLPLERLLDPDRQTSVVQTLKQAVKDIEEVQEEVQHTLSVLDVIHSGLSLSTLRDGVFEIIKFLKGKEKDLHIGLSVKMQMIYDRSFFDPYKALLSFSRDNFYLLESKVFLKIFLGQDLVLPKPDNSETFTDVLCRELSQAKASFQDYWLGVCSADNRSELHIVEGRKLLDEVEIAEKATVVKVPSEIYDALHLAGDYRHYLETTDHIRRVFEALNLNIDDDTTFIRAVEGIKSLEDKTGTCSLATLVNASQTFREVNKMLDTDTQDMLREFSKSQTLLEFIREIQGEDLRNLIDAVEEHSEQSVQEITVSSLIDVRRFLKPLLEEDLINSVVEVLTIMNTSKEENKLTNLATKLQECNTNLHSLKSLYRNVANRGEVTKDIVKALVQDENVEVQYEICANKKVDMMVKYKDDRKLKKNELNDYRSRALLLVNTDTSETNEDFNSQIREFIGFVDSALTTSSLYEQLVQSGYPEVNLTLLSVKRPELHGRETSLKKRLLRWESALGSARNTWYWLNHFYPEQITKIQLFMKSGAGANEVLKLFRSAGCLKDWSDSDIADPDLKHRMTRLYVNKTEMMDEFSLNAIGATLEGLMNNEIAVGPSFPDDTVEKQRVRPLDKVQSGELYVVNLADNSNIIPTLMTLYWNTTGHVPCHHQVLFCTEQTSWESILLHLNKCVYGKKRGFQKQLYCIVSVEKLCNEEQFKLVYKLKELGDSINYLAVICKGQSNHPLINHFSEQVHKLKPMLNKDLKNGFQTLWPGVSVLTSDLPGQGKTEMAQLQALDQGLDFISCHVSGLVSEETLIRKLSELDLHEKSLLHLDVGSLSNGPDADILLFKFVAFGYLSSGAKIFARPTNHIFVEIANSINGTLQNSLPTTQYFKCEHLGWTNFRNFRVSQELNSPVQVVCHYLTAYTKGTLDDADIYFSGDGVEEPLPEKECQNLLREMFASSCDLSFSVMNILLNVLADQLKKISCSLFLRTSHLFEMVGENNVKSSLVRAVLEVSKEFATRSVSTCREEQTETLKSKTEDNIVKSKGTSEVATASAMTARLRGMIQWKESNHLVISFHNQDIQTLSALYRDKTKVPEHVKNLFETQVKQDLPDYSDMSSSELMKRLEQIARSKPSPEEASEWNLSASYAMTPDNLLKMILIIMRMKSHVPVIIMGETGCGKTSLLRQLAMVCDITFLVKNMHAGIELVDIEASVENARNVAKQNLKEHVWLFFDEINTCDHMGLLNDLLCHHVYNGQNLPPNLSILAACNPYKLRQESNMLTAGLVTKIKTDEQSKLVYRVHPLSESMVDYVWDFGSLTDADEQAYIKSMVEKSLKLVESDLLVDLLVMSQEFIRQVDKSPFSVSLRDVNRCRLLVPWFRDSMLPKLSDQKIPHLLEIEAIIMALAHSYHSRLNQTEDREKYRENIAHILKTHGAVSIFSIACSGDYVFSIIHKYQEAILDKMTLPSGIARNTALQENVFVIFVCLLKHMPIFVVGKPGCSKSLSLQLLKSNLRGQDSDDKYFKTLPQLYYVSFQGSESSTSDGILKVFEKAQNYRHHNKAEDVLPVVILDEIGLAEISSYNPLKVLHSLLEPEDKEFPDVAVVGISNWALDAAKMNRAIHLSRPEMSEGELHNTAISIAEANSEANLSLSLKQAPQQRSLSDSDKRMLKALASAYFEYVGQQTHKNFHGLRDFYSLIKFISRKTSMHTMSESQTFSCILTGLLRNFGGLTSEIKFVIDTFNRHLKDFRRDDFDRACPSLLDLVHENITDCHARHLMLLTRGDSSLGIVEDLLRTQERQYMTILGSSFEEDQSDHYSYRILNRIILCMEQGITMILKDLETIYGSLYDMLNQNYTVVGSKKNCRIALGQHSNPLCQVHERFRCIVLVEEQKVDFTDPPFLNRFEKQRLVISDVLDEEMKDLAKKLKTTMEDLSKVSGFQAISPAQLVPIFNSDMIPSLVHSEFKLKKDLKTFDDIEKNCWQKLLTLCTPEGMVRAEKSALKTNDSVKLKSMREEYFKQKVHDGLEPYLYHLLKQFEEGVAAMIFTHSNIYTDLPRLLKDFPPNCQFEKLGAFKSEKQLTTRVKRFFSDPEQAWFFIQVSHTDQQHFLLMKSILEQETKLHLTAETDITAIKYVIIIIHIDRRDENRIELVNFLSGWHLAMMDTLEKQQLSLRQMLNSSLVDLSQKLLNDNGISRQELFSAFSFISYTDKSRPMESIEELVDIIFQNDVIKRVLYDLVNDWISNEPSLKRNLDWQLDVACSTAKLKTHLTFHAALLEDVKSKISHPLAAAVFTIEKLNGWDYLTPGKDITVSNERVERWQSLARSKQIVDITKVAEPKGIECYPCRLTTLDTKFPFSNFFIQRIETLNGVFLDIWRGQQLETGIAVVDETMCAKLSSMFRSSVKTLASQLLVSCLEIERIHDYFSDYCQWFAADLPLNMTEDQRIEVIKQAIKSRTDLEETDLDLFVTKIHVTGWLYKYKLQSEIILIDTCLSQLPISLEDIVSKTYKKDIGPEHVAQRDSNIISLRQNPEMLQEDMKEEIEEHDNVSETGEDLSETSDNDKHRGDEIRRFCDKDCEKGSETSANLSSSDKHNLRLRTVISEKNIKKSDPICGIPSDAESDDEYDRHTVHESDIDIAFENPEDNRHRENRVDIEIDEEDPHENKEDKVDRTVKASSVAAAAAAAADDDDDDDDENDEDDDEDDDENDEDYDENDEDTRHPAGENRVDKELEQEFPHENEKDKVYRIERTVARASFEIENAAAEDDDEDENDEDDDENDEDTRHPAGENKVDKELEQEFPHENEKDKVYRIQRTVTRPSFEFENAAAAAEDDDADADVEDDDDDENDEEDTIAASLVDLVCQYLIPSEQMKTKSVSEWQSMVNLVLSLTTDVSVQPAILETLRACNDLASMLLLPHNIDERYFWSIGTKLFNTYLDSKVVIDDLKIFVSDVKAILQPHEIQHFLSSYASCCLMANRQSRFMFKMFDIRRYIDTNIHDIEFLGSVFHHAIFLQYEEDPEELLEEENLDNDFFTSLQAILTTSQVDRIDSPLACVVIDVLQNHIFNNLIEQVEDDIQGFLGKLLELKRQYINREPNTIGSLVVIGYLKASLQHLANYLKKQKHVADNIWQKINQLFEDGLLAISNRVQSLQAFFLCCLVEKGGLFAVETEKEKFIQCKFLSEINTVFEKDLQANEQNPWYLHCKDQYQVVRKAASEIHQSKEPLCELFVSAATDFDLTYALFAFGMNEFYLVKGRNLKKHEEDLAQQLVTEAKDKLPCHKHRLFSSLCQQEDFSSELFQIQTSPAEHHMVLSILDILSTVFSSINCLDTSGDGHVLVDCICNPLSTVGKPIPGLPDYDSDVHPLAMKELRETSLFTYDCKCGCRLSFKEENNISNCPNCKNEISKDNIKLRDGHSDIISFDVAVMDNDSTSGMTDMDEKSASEEMEFSSVSEHTFCRKFCEIGSMETVRGMSSTSFRVMQFIYFGCLAGGAALGYSTEDDLYSRLHLDDKADPVKTLKSHLLHQWDCLKTILSMGDEQLSRFLNIVIFKSRGLLIEQIWHETARERNEFEHIFTETLMPLVKRRFDLIAEHVKLFNETCSEKEGFLEDILCETQNEELNKEGLPTFWRQITQPSTENLKSEFFLSESSEAFPILALVFMYEKELKLMKHITSLIQWHNCTVKHISYRYKKKEYEVKTLAQFQHSLEENETSKKEVKRALDKFTEAWKDITRMKEVIEKYTSDIGTFIEVHPNIELHKCIIVSQDSQVYQVLRGLVTMQNRFLDEAMNITVLHQVPSSSFLMRSKGCASAPIVRVEDVAEHQVVKELDFTDLLKFSQCNTKYAHGQEVFYDFYQIERDIALQCLMKKTHIVFCDSFPKITFSGELLHTASTLLCEITKLVPQDPLGPATVQQLGKMDPANRNVLMNYLEMTFFLIKRTSVSSADKKQNLGEFLEKWQYIFHYRVSDVDDFCSNVCLCHTVALYELVEQYMAEDVVLRDSYKESMPIDGKMTLEGNDFADEMYLKALVKAMSKFAYRYLQTAEVDGDEQMSGLLKDTSLWPRGDIPKLNINQEGSYRSQDVYLLSPSICVKHIYYTVEFIKEKLEKLKERPTLETQPKKKKNKAQKNKGWKK